MFQTLGPLITNFSQHNNNKQLTIMFTATCCDSKESPLGYD